MPWACQRRSVLSDTPVSPATIRGLRNGSSRSCIPRPPKAYAGSRNYTMRANLPPRPCTGPRAIRDSRRPRSTVGEREFDAERDKRGGERAAHPRQHLRTRDDVPANPGGKQPVSDEHGKRQEHEHGAQLEHAGERTWLVGAHKLRQERKKEH